MPDKFNYVKQGYNPAEVDNYVDTLENVIKSYKEKDSAIKNAIISAQVAAENIIKNAELEAQDMKVKTMADIKHITESLEKQKEEIKNFQNDYAVLLGKYLKNFEENDFSRVYSTVNEMENFLFTLKKQMNETEKDENTVNAAPMSILP